MRPRYSAVQSSMADKNQLGLANGSPPQFSSSNSTKQPNFVSQSQTQIRYSLGVDHSLNSNQFQKPPISLPNGQIPLTSKNTNWQQESGHLISNYSIGAGDSQQPSAVTQVLHSTQTTRPNVNFPVGNLKLPQNISSPSNQQDPPVSMVGHTFPHQQVSPSLNPVQNIKPLPALGSKQSVTYSLTGQQSDISQVCMPQQTQTLAAQHSGSIPTSLGPPPVSSQNNKTLFGPPTSSNIPPKSSPYNKNLVPNLPYSNYMAPHPNASQELRPSPLHHNLAQGSQPDQLHFPSNSQSQSHFLPPNSQPAPLQSGFHRIPHGYQPLLTGANPAAQTSAMPSVPFSHEKQPSSALGTPTNQLQANKTLGPPPLSQQMSGAPPPLSVPHQHNSLHRLPASGNSYGSLKPMEMDSLSHGMGRMSVTQQGFNKLWGMETVDLLQCRNILPPRKVTPPPIRLHQEFMDNVNCSPEIFCCTLNKIPETNSLLQKSRLPLGILIHPFRDLKQLAVIQCSSIVRCRACRTYINPFVYFVDNKRWKCNLCFRVNELPDEFQYDPVSKTYGDPSRRPEIRSSTIEFIAPSEYMLRPPQPAIYLFVLDVSRWGCDSGYLETLCTVLLEELDNIPGDSRTQIGFILFDSAIHFFSIAENYNQAHEMIVTDIDDVFLPTPDTLLVNLNENRQLIKDLLHEIPKKYMESFDTDSALGPALQAAYKLMSPTGGRITVFQSCLPNKGPGALSPREDPNQRSSRDVRHLGPQTDFYKRLSLDCSTQQISVDLFLVSSQYSDLATLGGVSQFSGGCIYHFPLFRKINPEINERLSRALRRYLTRKIGFEAVMRVRCSRGLSIHTFHGNFFVRSTDLLSLPNVNPDAGFGMQIAIEDSLFELQTVCFQAAVLYTSAKGERRIRVHTLCLPVSSNLSDILTSADQQAIIGLLGKMAVDRSLKSTLLDAREAFINAAVDILSAYKLVETSGGQNTILAPINLSLIPLYILALLKSTAFRTGQSTRLDDRIYAMSQMKTLPLRELIQLIHPDFYHVTHLEDETGVEFEDKPVPQPARLSLSSEHLDSRGAYLLDTPEVIYLMIGKNISTEFLINIFDVRDIKQINKDMVDLPELENEESEKLRHFINYLQAEKPWPAVIKIVTEPNILVPFLITDKAENALSYYELLNHIKAQLK